MADVAFKDGAGASKNLKAASGDGSGGSPFVLPAGAGIGDKADTLATDSVSSWSVIALLKGLYALLATTLVFRLVVGTSGGTTPYHLISAASTNATVVKPSAGQIFGVQLVNRNTTTCLKVVFHDVATTPVAGSTAVKKDFVLPAAVSASQPTVVTHSMSEGISFAAGIAITTVADTGLDSDATAVAAHDLTINVDYK